MSAPRTDTDRLEWLIANDANFGRTSHLERDERGVLRWNSKPFLRVPCRHLYEWHIYEAATPREAIDVAMDGPRCALVDGREGTCTLSHFIRFDEGGGDHPLQRQVFDLRAEVERLSRVPA